MKDIFVNNRRIVLMIKKATRNSFFTSLVLIIFAFMITIVAFYPNRPFLSWDGIFHMSRFSQIAESLKHYQLPAMISLVGGNNNMNAMTSMYPWISNLFVIVPMMFFRPVIAIFIGIFLINVITAINSYLMMRYLTTNKVYRFLGVTLYLYNAYHLIDLYAKFDFGEVTAYAFLPLIVLGLYHVWDNQNNGVLFLSMGFVGVANAHILSLLIATIVVVLIEIYRIIRRKFTFNEFKSFIISAVVSFLGSLFSLLQIVYISTHNSLNMPFKGWNQCSLKETFNDIISNQFHEYFGTWNLGIVMTIIMVFLVVKLLFDKGQIQVWNKYTVAILVLILLIYDVFPLGNKLSSTFMGVLQFPGRLLILATILIIIAFTRYLNSNQINNWRVLLLILLAVVTACSSISTYSNMKYDNLRRASYSLTSKSLNKVINTKTGLMDYVPKAMVNDYSKNTSYNVKTYKVGGDYKRAEYKIVAKKTGEISVPLAYINGVRYIATVNSKREEPKVRQGQMTFYLKKGNNSVIIRSQTSGIWYIIFGVSMITIFTLVLYSLWKLWGLLLTNHTFQV